MTITSKQTMTAHPATARAKDDLHAAYIRMRREGFRHLPVIDDNGGLAGIISDRDFQRAMNSATQCPLLENTAEPQFPKDAKVRDYMSWPVQTLAEDTPLLTAVNLMIQKKISAVVVLKDNQITGIITVEDLLCVLAALLDDSAGSKKKILSFGLNFPLRQISDVLSQAGI